MTQIQAIDLAAPYELPKGASIVGAADMVYSDADTLVIAARSWSGYATTMSESLDKSPVSQVYTHLHAFDLTSDPAQPHYTASGTVPGSILNQFSLDIHNGYLRVATTDDRVISGNEYWWNTERVNHVFVLGTEGDSLTEVGSVRDLAPDERIYSARFLGDRGYLVTFRQVDPLFVLDLANPSAPTVLGELKIPGFSEYMHPLDENHLLTIGQDGGLALQIFDVTNPVSPKQKHKYVFSKEDMYGYSEAQSNHKAFNYYAPHKLLAFPFVGWGYSNGSMRSSLELFDIDKDKGISRRGSIDHSALFGNEYGYYGSCGVYDAHVRRGLFLGNFVYSISYGGVIVNDISNLVEPLATLALDAPQSDYSYTCWD